MTAHPIPTIPTSPTKPPRTRQSRHGRKRKPAEGASTVERSRRSDFVALRELPNVIGRAESQGLNGHGRLAAPRGDETRPIAEKEIRHIVRAVVFVDHRSGGIVAHAAGAPQMGSSFVFFPLVPPDPLCARPPHALHLALLR